MNATVLRKDSAYLKVQGIPLTSARIKILIASLKLPALELVEISNGTYR